MSKKLQQYYHVHGTPSRGKILMVLSSPTVSKQTGWPIGFWASELTHPLRAFIEAGMDIELASTEGGKVEMDSYSNPLDESGYSAGDVVSLGFMQLDWFNQMLAETKKLSEVNSADYDAIFLVGGQGPMYTYRGNVELEKLFVSFLENQKPAAAVCHSTTLLLEAKLNNGDLVVKNKEWTGFANSEEDYADQAAGTKIQPYRIEDEAQKIDNTKFITSSAFQAFAIRDGNLITGQQQNSGELVASLVLEAMTEK